MWLLGRLLCMGAQAHHWPIDVGLDARLVACVRVLAALVVLAAAGFLAARAIAPHGTPSQPARLIAPA
jgi:hypothetical protein